MRGGFPWGGTITRPARRPTIATAAKSCAPGAGQKPGMESCPLGGLTGCRSSRCTGALRRDLRVDLVEQVVLPPVEPAGMEGLLEIEPVNVEVVHHLVKQRAQEGLPGHHPTARRRPHPHLDTRALAVFIGIETVQFAIVTARARLQHLHVDGGGGAQVGEQGARQSPRGPLHRGHFPTLQRRPQLAGRRRQRPDMPQRHLADGVAATVDALALGRQPIVVGKAPVRGSRHCPQCSRGDIAKRCPGSCGGRR